MSKSKETQSEAVLEIQEIADESESVDETVEEGKLLYSNFINGIKAKAPTMLGVPQEQQQLALVQANEGEVVNL